MLERRLRDSASTGQTESVLATTELPVRQKGLCCELELSPDPTWAADKAQLLKALADPTRLAMV